MFEKYDAYKDSGVEWIGNIPAKWSLKKISHIFRNIGSGTTPLSGSDIYYKNGYINWLQTGDLNDGYIDETSKKITEKALRHYSTLKQYPKGSLVVAMYGATIGKVGILNIDTATNQACCVLGANLGVNIKYYFYMFQGFKADIIRMAYGGGQPNISQDTIKKLRLPFPDLSTQHEISKFLDQKTTEIDQAIAIKEQQIALLNERKQIVIQKAVTQGLEPNVPMKDSGVEWIGQIPEHWEILPLTKYSTRVDYRGKTPEKVEEGRLLVTTRNIKNGILDYEISKEYIKESQYKEVMSRGIPKKGDILFTMEAPLGHSAVVDREDIAIAQRIIKFRLDSERLNSYFINYYFQTDIFQNYLYGLGTGSTALGIKASKLGLLKLIAPNLYEQEKIVAFLITEEDKFNSAFELLNQEISKLKEYKTTLINDAVTGKIKVA